MTVLANKKLIEPTMVPLAKKTSIGEIAQQAQRAVEMVAQVRGRMLSPTARKTAPIFSGAQVATLCKIDKSHLNYRITKNDLPTGTVNGPGRRREFTLAETRTWVKAYNADAARPLGARAVTIAVGNFKGGVSKTTTAMTLAQGLSLRGHSILVLDLDPQGSLTTLHGILPDAEVDEADTVSLLCGGEQESVRYAIRSTYWDGIDLVPAAPSLFSAEFVLPSRQMQDKSFEFWNVINKGLEDVRDAYDVIIIDTPPALSYLTINAFMAADGLIVPLPPNALDFASSAQFWSLFSDLASGLEQSAGVNKTFNFINVLLSRVDMSDTASGIVRGWIAATYGEKVLPVEIPKTAVTSATSAEFGTVYDIARYEGSQKTYQRAREAYDRLTELIEQSIVDCWKQHN